MQAYFASAAQCGLGGVAAGFGAGFGAAGLHPPSARQTSISLISPGCGCGCGGSAFGGGDGSAGGGSCGRGAGLAAAVFGAGFAAGLTAGGGGGIDSTTGGSITGAGTGGGSLAQAASSSATPATKKIRNARTPENQQNAQQFSAGPRQRPRRPPSVDSNIPLALVLDLSNMVLIRFPPVLVSRPAFRSPARSQAGQPARDISMTAHAANARAITGPVTPNGAASAAAQRPAPAARIPAIEVSCVWSFKVPVAGAQPFEITRVLAAAQLAEHDDQPGDYVLTAITLFSMAAKPALVDEDSDLFDRIALDLLAAYRPLFDRKWAEHVASLAGPVVEPAVAGAAS